MGEGQGAKSRCGRPGETSRTLSKSLFFFFFFFAEEKNDLNPL